MMQASSRRIKGSRRGATWHGRDDELQHRPTVVSYNTLDPSHCKAARVDSALQIYQDFSFMYYCVQPLLDSCGLGGLPNCALPANRDAQLKDSFSCSVSITRTPNWHCFRWCSTTGV